MFTRTSTQPAATTVEHVRVRVNGRAMIATPVGDTVVIAHDQDLFRCSITTRTTGNTIAFSIEDDIEQRGYDALQKVREHARLPQIPKSRYPSERVQAERVIARQRHEAVWQHGYNEGQARFAALPLAEKVTDANLDELIELAMRAVLGNPELRNSFRAALDGADIEEALAAEQAG